jgi:hypothetical protein
MRHSSFSQLTLLGCFLSVVVACASQPTPASSPTELTPPAEQAAATPAPPPVADTKERGHGQEGKAASNDNALVALLPSSKIGLAEGIALAERKGGTAISAKFELEDGKLSLSVYAAKSGLETDAEHNVLAELSGDPTQPEWQPKEEVFSDTKHLTRASYHLTLVQRSKMSLASVIAKALAKQPGQVYAVEPAIHERSPIFHVAIATAGGGRVNVDVESGA